LIYVLAQLAGVSQPNEVFDVLKQVRVPSAILLGAICAQNCAMFFDTQDSSGER
jgi:hypothetical protein